MAEIQPLQPATSGGPCEDMVLPAAPEAVVEADGPLPHRGACRCLHPRLPASSLGEGTSCCVEAAPSQVTRAATTERCRRWVSIPPGIREDKAGSWGRDRATCCVSYYP